MLFVLFFYKPNVSVCFSLYYRLHLNIDGDCEHHITIYAIMYVRQTKNQVSFTATTTTPSKFVDQRDMLVKSQSLQKTNNISWETKKLIHYCFHLTLLVSKFWLVYRLIHRKKVFRANWFSKFVWCFAFQCFLVLFLSSFIYFFVLLVCLFSCLFLVFSSVLFCCCFFHCGKVLFKHF